MVVCHCHRVSDRTVETAVDAGAARVGQVVRSTTAGTDCGGCLPALRRLCESYFAQQERGEMLSATG